MYTTLTRRDFVRVSALSASAGILAACGAPAPTSAPGTATPAPAGPTVTGVPETPAPAGSQPPAAASARYTESPLLAERVAKGELPPVEERLPNNPYVVPVMESIGKFGGTLRRAFNGMSDAQGPRKCRERGFVWFDPDLTMRPALAESWELSEDGSQWTWRLRAGTKWSDGTPFTTADAVWYWEYRLKDEILSPLPPAAYSTGDPSVLAEFAAVDDETLVLTFAHPNPQFAYRTAWEYLPFTPAHYMQQFHPAFADQAALEAQAKNAGLDTWDKFYAQMEREDLNPDKPTLSIFKPQNTLSDELFVMERNPYFWAVDSEGQQLPYLDRINHRLFSSPDVFNLWVVNGEIDFQNRHVSIGNYTLFKESEASGDYQVLLGTNENHVGMNPNHTAKDPRLAEFFGDRNVRVALSYAINREEINDLVYDGLAVPRQYSPMVMSPQYHEALSNAYIEYDPDGANRLLDEAGYAARGADGFRQFKDGSGDALSIVIEGLWEAGSPEEDAAQLTVRYLQDVGIKATYSYLERSLYQERTDANEVACGWWGGDRTELPMTDPGIFIGTQTQRPWAGAWGLWKRSGGTDPNGVEPPADHWIWDIWNTYDQVIVEPDYHKAIELFAHILDIWAEQLPMVTCLGEFPAPVIVKNGFRNFVPGYPIGRMRCDEHLFGIETYFWEEPENHA